MELDRSNAENSKGGYSPRSKSLLAFALPELILCLLLLLSRLVVSSSSMLAAGVWVNCITYTDARVTSRSVVSTLDLVVLCRVVISLMYLIHPMDASRYVLNFSHLIQA